MRMRMGVRVRVRVRVRARARVRVRVHVRVRVRVRVRVHMCVCACGRDCDLVFVGRCARATLAFSAMAKPGYLEETTAKSVFGTSFTVLNWF